MCYACVRPFGTQPCELSRAHATLIHREERHILATGYTQDPRPDIYNILDLGCRANRKLLCVYLLQQKCLLLNATEPKLPNSHILQVYVLKYTAEVLACGDLLGLPRGLQMV